jgi:hypothetical protein
MLPEVTLQTLGLGLHVYCVGQHGRDILKTDTTLQQGDTVSDV